MNRVAQVVIEAAKIRAEIAARQVVVPDAVPYQDTKERDEFRQVVVKLNQVPSE